MRRTELTLFVSLYMCAAGPHHCRRHALRAMPSSRRRRRRVMVMMMLIKCETSLSAQTAKFWRILAGNLDEDS